MELINLLVKEGLLNVIYTTDGKDIITEQRLIREILDEIYGNGGNFDSLNNRSKTYSFSIQVGSILLI